MKKINRRPTAGWRDRGKRWLAWPLMGLLAILLLMPVAVHWLSEPAQAQASSQTQEGSNERANYWRAVRDGVSGYTAVQGRETNVLIKMAEKTGVRSGRGRSSSTARGCSLS